MIFASDCENNEYLYMNTFCPISPTLLVIPAIFLDIARSNFSLAFTI